MAKIKPRPERKPGIKKSNSSSNPDRHKDASSGGNNKRSQATIKRLNMYRGGKPKRNRKGQIVKAADYQAELPSGTQARVAPNRKWFGNTRVIKQSSLQKFQEEVGKAVHNPYQVVLKSSKLPMSLLKDRSKKATYHILDSEPFEHTFGKKSRRKRPNMQYSSIEEMVKGVEERHAAYDASKDSNIKRENVDGTLDPAMANYMGAGQSKRIWNELYKVLDCSDVVIQVLDARDPMGTRCHRVEKYLRCEKPHKHLIFILNKCDLVPAWITKAWVAKLSSERPTLAFHASINNSFGKGALINLLRQFGKLHSEKKNISCGFIGYPNVGKSSIINTLCKKAVCKAAPLAGETKVWQYITLMSRIFLIDCPGIVQPSGDSETEVILKGVIRVENVHHPDEHIAEVLRRVKKEYIMRQYLICQWTDSEDFLTKMAYKTGKLLKGGLPDLTTCAKKVLNDWQRGRIPYFVRPTGFDDDVKTSQQQSDVVVEPELEVVDGDVDKKRTKTAIELEKELKPINQALDQVKTGFKFTEDGDVIDGPNIIEFSDEDEDDADAAGTSSSAQPAAAAAADDNDDDEGVTKLSKKERRSLELKRHRRKMKKMDARIKKIRDSIFDVDKLNKEQQKRIDDEEAARQSVIRYIKKQRSRPFDQDSDDDADLTSKQKRRKIRDSTSKKTGSDFYDKVNVKKRKRNKHNPKADVQPKSNNKKN